MVFARGALLLIAAAALAVGCGAHDAGERASAAERVDAADSAMARHLGSVLFLADTAMLPGFRDCADDEGSENAPLLAAAVRARVVGRRVAVEPNGAEYGVPGPIRRLTYAVEVASVATLVPGWIARVADMPATEGKEVYVARVKSSVDTFQVVLEDLGSSAKARWAVCDPGGRAVTQGDGPGFWKYVHAQSSWVQVVRWEPEGGSWEKLVSAARESGGSSRRE